MLPPNPKIRYRGPVTYSVGFHTSTTFRIVSAPAGISPESTWGSTMLPKGTLDSGRYLFPFRSNEKGYCFPRNPKIRYRDPVTYSDGVHTSTTFQIFSSPGEISPESTWESTMLPKGALDLGGYLRPFRSNERGYFSPPIKKSAIGAHSLIVMEFIHRPLSKLLAPRRKFLLNRHGIAQCFRKSHGFWGYISPFRPNERGVLLPL